MKIETNLTKNDYERLMTFNDGNTHNETNFVTKINDVRVSGIVACNLVISDYFWTIDGKRHNIEKAIFIYTLYIKQEDIPYMELEKFRNEVIIDKHKCYCGNTKFSCNGDIEMTLIGYDTLELR